MDRTVQTEEDHKELQDLADYLVNLVINNRNARSRIVTLEDKGRLLNPCLQPTK